MKKILMFTIVLLFSADAMAQGVSADVKLKSYLGSRIDACIAGRVMTQDMDEIVRAYADKRETSLWQSEFWGKWMLGACDSYLYNHDKALLEKIKSSVDALLATQETSGYIGNYAPEARLAQWDVWGQKYTLLGLQAYYKISSDERVLKAACRVADYLIDAINANGADIATLGNYKGLAAGSVLEPMVFLFNNTGNKRYLDFAKSIVASWETPQGPMLISKALKDIPVAERFLPVPDAMHWTLNGHKAYEMMSCYIGLLELYKVTGNPTYLQAVQMTVNQIVDKELTIVGSASSTECFWGGTLKQTTPAFLSNETCVTYTWMELCDRLFRVTGNPMYIDQFERTAYNALQASLKYGGHNIASYVPLEGFRRIGERQCGLNFNCCEANGPRGFALIPQVAVTLSKSSVYVNLYETLVAKTSVADVTVESDYPISNEVKIMINPHKNQSQIDVNLRIPLWSVKSRVCVNGQTVNDAVLPGGYYTISRKWSRGDVISLKLDMTGKVVFLNNSLAVVRGPIVFARDSRFNDGFVDETIAVQHDADLNVVMTPVADKPQEMWMAFSVEALTSIYSGDKASFRPIKLCDFGSAGNTWNEQVRYKVWLPRTIETADRHTWW